MHLRRNTNALEDARKRHKRLHIRSRERVLQLDRGSDASCREGTRQEADVGLLVKVDLHQVGVEGIGEAGGYEVGLGVVCKSLLVELSFKVFESQGIVELLLN